MHYGLFAENTADPANFVEKCKKAGIKTFLFEIGKPVELDSIFLGKIIENKKYHPGNRGMCPYRGDSRDCGSTGH